MGAEGGDEGEFVFVGGVDDDGADAGAYQIGDDGGVVRDECVEVEVEMGVVEGRHRRRWRRLLTEHAEDTERKPRDAVRGEGGGGGVRWKRAVEACGLVEPPAGEGPCNLLGYTIGQAEIE